MYKKNQGITMISLVITVIIMVALLAVTINIGRDVIHRSQIEDIKTNMLTIQGKAKIIKEKHDFGEGELIGEGTVPGDMQNKINSYNINNSYGMWTKTVLESVGLDTIKADGTKEYYVVDYTNDCEVYYSLGMDGEYSLSALKDM